MLVQFRSLRVTHTQYFLVYSVTGYTELFLSHTITQRCMHQRQCGVQYLSQRHLNMWSGEAMNHTTNLLIDRQLLFFLAAAPHLVFYGVFDRGSQKI